jgi:hypothetical protein
VAALFKGRKLYGGFPLLFLRGEILIGFSRDFLRGKKTLTKTSKLERNHEKTPSIRFSALIFKG